MENIQAVKLLLYPVPCHLYALSNNTGHILVCVVNSNSLPQDTCYAVLETLKSAARHSLMNKEHFGIFCKTALGLVSLMDSLWLFSCHKIVCYYPQKEVNYIHK